MSAIKTHTTGGYNFYTVTAEGKTFIIGGVPEKFSDDYINIAASCDAAVLLTSKPEFTGGLGRLLDINPDIEIYGGSAALRNIKEILNREINEKLIKDNMSVCGIRFMVMPNLHWVDTVMAIYDGVLFSGEAFSGYDGSAVGLKKYYDARIAVNKPYVQTAVKRLMDEDISAIYPAYGMTCPQGSVCMSAMPGEVFNKYLQWSAEPERERRTAAVVYSSEYGYTKELADRAVCSLEKFCDVNVYDVKAAAEADIIRGVNSADMLIIGTNTINRNAPQEIWRAVTQIDLVNKKGMPYLVFGSFGWAGDGIRLIDKTLTAMGMRCASKPVDVLFKPADKDMERIDKAVERIVEYDNKNCAKQ